MLLRPVPSLALALLALATVSAGCADPVEDTHQQTPRTGQQRLTDDAGRPLAQRPHTHDLWGGAASITLFEGNVPLYVYHNHLFDEPPREQHTHGCEESLTSESQGGSVKFSFPPPTTVIPGTSTLELTFAWSDPSIFGVRLLFRAADAHEFTDAGQVTNREPMRIDVTATMADDGHASSSHWAFFLCADSDKPLDLAQGTVHAEIVAIKGEEIPVEPPHPPSWHGRAGHLVAQLMWQGEPTGVLNKGEEAFHRAEPLEGRIIPWDATAVWVNVSLSPEPSAEPPLPMDVIVYWRDPTVPEWVYARAVATGGGTERSLRIVVEEGMADSVYATGTLWDFWVRLASAQRADAPSGLGTWSAPHRYVGGLAVDVTAVR